MSSVEAKTTPSIDDAATSIAIQPILKLFEQRGVHCAAVYSQQHNAVVYIVIDPKDIVRLRDVCKDLKQVKLVRKLGSSCEEQIIIDNGGGAKSRYSSVRVVPRYLHETIDGNIRSRLKTVARYTRAWLHPNGLFCVLLGPDGVGKSTTILRLQSELQSLFGPCNKERWRPGIVRKVAPDIPNRMPHTRTSRGSIVSVLFILGLALDFSIGYVISAFPAMARSETLIFDRYFHDLLIDPKRYRYAGPMCLPRYIRRFIPPRKAIFIILDANEEVILHRKQELPLNELRRQRIAYRNFSLSVPNSMIVSTDQPVEEIVSEIVDKIIGILTRECSLTRPHHLLL